MPFALHQVGAERGKRANGRVANLPYEAQILTAGPASWTLWRLLLVLKEISENLEPHSDEKQHSREARDVIGE
jgi:hypothetical protein